MKEDLSSFIAAEVVAELRRAPVAQLDRALACGAKGRRFESCRVYQVKKVRTSGLFYLVYTAGLGLRPANEVSVGRRFVQE